VGTVSPVAAAFEDGFQFVKITTETCAGSLTVLWSEFVPQQASVPGMVI
jgi:hypothetical protein